MQRRQVLQGAGLASLGLAASLAGCSDGDGDGDDGDSGGGSLAVTSVDTEDIGEPNTVFMVATVENSGEESGTGLVRGEIDDDGTVYEQHREVTVAGGESRDVNIKFRFDTGIVTVFTRDAAMAEDSEQENDDGFHDLVVTDYEGPSDDGIESGNGIVTAEVTNRGTEERTATLEAEVTVDNSASTGQQEVTLGAGESDSVVIAVSVTQPSGVYTYDGSAYFPAQ